MYIALLSIINLTAILFANIRIRLHYNFADRRFISSLTIFGISTERKKHSSSKIKIYYRTIRYIAEKSRIKYLKFNTLIGLGDAVADVFAVQLVRNLFYSVYCVFNSAFTEKTQLFVKILPAFNQETLKLDFECIITIRLGYIIIAFLRHYIKILISKARRILN